MLDRRITIERNHAGWNEYGEYSDDWQPVATVWAQQNAAGLSDVETEAGVVVSAVRNYSIRWRSDLHAVSPAVLRVRDAAGTLWMVDSLQESDARRRFLSIQCVRAE